MFEKRVAFIANQMMERIILTCAQDPTAPAEISKPARQLFYNEFRMDDPTLKLNKLKYATQVLIEVLAIGDPTANLQYVQWIAQRYCKKDFRFEDLARVKEELATFERFKPRLRKDGKETDINRYKTTGDVFQLIEYYRNADVPHSQKEAARREEDQFIDDGDATWFFKGSKIKIVIPGTKEAARHFGKGTRWCTAAAQSHNFFDTYHKQGPLYVIMTPTGKYQFHFPTRQFMTALDQPTSVVKLAIQYPELKDAFDPVAQAMGFIPLMKVVTSSGLYNALDTLISKKGHDEYYGEDNVTVADLVESVDKKVQTPEIAMLVIKHNPSLALRLIRPDIQATLNFQHAMIERRPELLQSADPLNQTPELVAAVIRRAPPMLRYVRKDLLTESLILEAVKQTPQVLGQIPATLQTLEVIKTAFRATENRNTKRVLISMVHNKALKAELTKTLKEAS